tara:strand:- start:75 stop:578 length:504 start_codon:yes stop_codon:yes gene_type:complete
VGSAAKAIGVRDYLKNTLETIDGSSTVNADNGSISHTFNVDLSSSVTLGGDARAGTAVAAATIDLEEIRVDPDAGPLGALLMTGVFIIRVRSKPSANTAEKRQEAAANAASDVAAALMQDRSMGGLTREVRLAISARDGDGTEDEWAAGCGLVVVGIEADWCNWLGV